MWSCTLYTQVYYQFWYFSSFNVRYFKTLTQEPSIWVTFTEIIFIIIYFLTLSNSLWHCLKGFLFIYLSQSGLENILSLNTWQNDFFLWLWRDFSFFFFSFFNYGVIKRQIQNSLCKRKTKKQKKTFDSRKSNKMKMQTGAFFNLFNNSSFAYLNDIPKTEWITAIPAGRV